MEKKQIEEMIDLAIRQLDHSYVPYSHFHVGAALLAKNGTYYTGCNIENAAYTPTNCAERTAFFKAVSEGVREFQAICIVGGKDGVLTEYAAPCGVCRQVMMEFCDPETFQIIITRNTPSSLIRSSVLGLSTQALSIRKSPVAMSHLAHRGK